VLAGKLLQHLLGRAGQRLGMVQERPEAGELREQHHVHPRIVVHGDLNALLHGLEVAGILEIHLNAGNGVWHHVVLAFNVGAPLDPTRGGQRALITGQ
jgi:hypothetical protein